LEIGAARLRFALADADRRENERAHEYLTALGVRETQARTPYRLGLKRRIELLIGMCGGLKEKRKQRMRG
jgi:hypothetical protein